MTNRAALIPRNYILYDLLNARQFAYTSKIESVCQLPSFTSIMAQNENVYIPKHVSIYHTFIMAQLL